MSANKRLQQGNRIPTEWISTTNAAREPPNFCAYYAIYIVHIRLNFGKGATHLRYNFAGQ
jgi:hypothetical protein